MTGNDNTPCQRVHPRPLSHSTAETFALITYYARSPSASKSYLILMRMQGNPIKLSGYEDATTRPPAPALDGDRQAILDWLGLN